MMTAKQVGKQLVAMCQQGRFLDALAELYSPQIVSVEAHGDATMPAVLEGIEAVRGKGEWWVANHEIHAFAAPGPFPNGDRFAVIFRMEVTPTVGPMAGQRMSMEEVALYTTAGGKIVREEFYYDMGG